MVPENIPFAGIMGLCVEHLGENYGFEPCGYFRKWGWYAGIAGIVIIREKTVARLYL